MSNNSPKRPNSIFTVAVIAALFALGFCRPAAAQYPAQGSDGHAHDANNRIGSGGQNTPRTENRVTGNDIVNGNVTAGKEFHGPLGELDPRAFMGPAPGVGIDDFVRQSAGVPTSYGANQTVFGQAQTFYGDSRYTAPPAGSLPVGFNGGYIGTGTQTPFSLSNGFNTASYLEGLQSRTTDRNIIQLNQDLNAGNFNAAQNVFNQTGTLNEVPVYGLHTITNGIDNYNSPDLIADRFGLDNQTVGRMRQELQLNPNPNPTAPAGTTPQQPTGLNQPLNQPLGRPFESPADTAISHSTNTQIANNPLSSTGTIPSNIGTPPSLIPPEQQSPLLNTLQQRLEMTSDVGKAMADARAAHPTPAANPAAAKTDSNTAGGMAPGSSPIKVTTLAEGIKAKGLHDLLAGAEDLIRQGKYDLAIQNYNQAQRVAPNNPLSLLGRANAELAAEYYARAEQDLRTAYRINPGLLLLQFDLETLLPNGRASDLRKDLQDLAQKDVKSERPWFMLAYLDYNSNDSATAQKDIFEAEQRSGRADATLRRMRQYWPLPSTAKPVQPPHPPAVPQATPELNK